MLFSSKNAKYYMFTAVVVLIVSYFANKWKRVFDDNNDESNKLIQEYLLNETPLYGHNRPKLWIHTTHEINARKWKDFYSRNTTDLNQPYVHLTIKTIINHCGNDFNVCLIDDESFSTLLPSWEINMSKTAEPMKSRYRELALLQLIYIYGGMVVPNSFVCMKNMKEFYETNTEGDRPFVCENINRHLDMKTEKQRKTFTPDTYIMGAEKNNQTIFYMAAFLKDKYKSPHLSNEYEFIGLTSQLCTSAIRGEQMNLVGGEMVGVKTNERKPILLENLMEEEYLDLNRNAVGIYIPMNEILNRPKYQWFSVLPAQQILNSNMIISKYITASIVDTTDEYKKSTEIKSTVVRL